MELNNSNVIFNLWDVLVLRGTSFLLGLSVSYLLFKLFKFNKNDEVDYEIDELKNEKINDSCEINFSLWSKNSDSRKIIFFIRNDLGMSKGKIAAQCSHAVVGVCQKVIKTNPDLLKKWNEFNQPKLFYKVDSEKDLKKISKDANILGLPNYIVVDAGRTQIACHSRTVIAVGPGDNYRLNLISASYKNL